MYKMLALLLVLAFVTVALSGCCYFKKLDAAISGTATKTPEQIEAGEPPPIVESIAGILLLSGYGGLAEWIRRTRKNGKVATAELTARIEKLETQATTKSP